MPRRRTSDSRGVRHGQGSNGRWTDTLWGYSRRARRVAAHEARHFFRFAPRGDRDPRGAKEGDPHGRRAASSLVFRFGHRHFGMCVHETQRLSEARRVRRVGRLRLCRGPHLRRRGRSHLAVGAGLELAQSLSHMRGGVSVKNDDHDHDHDHHDHGDHHGHNHDHAHTHLADLRDLSRRRLLVALALTSTFLIVEIGAGIWSGSLALLSDAGHMLTDAGALGLALWAQALSTRPRSDRKTFGYRRAEILAAAANGIVLGITAVGVIVEANRATFRASPRRRPNHARGCSHRDGRQSRRRLEPLPRWDAQPEPQGRDRPHARGRSRFGGRHRRGHSDSRVRLEPRRSHHLDRDLCPDPDRVVASLAGRDARLDGGGTGGGRCRDARTLLRVRPPGCATFTICTSGRSSTTRRSSRRTSFSTRGLTASRSRALSDVGSKKRWGRVTSPYNPKPLCRMSSCFRQGSSCGRADLPVEQRQELAQRGDHQIGRAPVFVLFGRQRLGAEQDGPASGAPPGDDVELVVADGERLGWPRAQLLAQRQHTVGGRLVGGRPRACRRRETGSRTCARTSPPLRGCCGSGSPSGSPAPPGGRAGRRSPRSTWHPLSPYARAAA